MYRFIGVSELDSKQTIFVGFEYSECLVKSKNIHSVFGEDVKKIQFSSLQSMYLLAWSHYQLKNSEGTQTCHRLGGPEVWEYVSQWASQICRGFLRHTLETSSLLIDISTPTFEKYLFIKTKTVVFLSGRYDT